MRLPVQSKAMPRWRTRPSLQEVPSCFPVSPPSPGQLHTKGSTAYVPLHVRPLQFRVLLRLTHVTARITRFSVFITEWCYVVWIQRYFYSFFNDSYLGYFQFGVLWTKPLWTSSAVLSVGIMFSYLLSKYIAVGLLDCICMYGSIGLAKKVLFSFFCKVKDIFHFHQ